MLPITVRSNLCGPLTAFLVSELDTHEFTSKQVSKLLNVIWWYHL